MGDLIRQAVLIDMAYEIGGAGLSNFRNLLACYRAGEWAGAAAALKNSLLYSQVPKREQENMMILALGEFPAGVTCAEDLIKRHEGCVLTAQPDAKGKWALGYGHDIPPPLEGGLLIECSEAEAEEWFDNDFALATARAEVDLGSEYWSA